MKMASLAVAAAVLCGAGFLAGFAQAAEIKVLGTPAVRELRVPVVRLRTHPGRPPSSRWPTSFTPAITVRPFLCSRMVIEAFEMRNGNSPRLGLPIT